MVRIVFYMLKTGMSKSKLGVDLNLMLKRSNKAVTNLFFHHLHHQPLHLYHRSGGDVIPSPLIRDYEFSCSNSPAYPLASLYHHKRKYHHHRGGGGSQLVKATFGYDDVTTVAAVQRVLEMLSSNSDVGDGVAESPVVKLPGFGRGSLALRQLRVMDSPFRLKREDSYCDTVDKAAEEFIKRFHKDLKLQKKMTAALEFPYPDKWDRSMINISIG